MKKSDDIRPLARVLIIENDELRAGTLASTFQELGCEIVGTATSGNEAVRQAEVSRPDLVVVNVALMDDPDVITAAAQIRSLLALPVIAVSESPGHRSRDNDGPKPDSCSLDNGLKCAELQSTTHSWVAKDGPAEMLRPIRKESGETPQDLAEEALRESEAKYRFVVEHAAEAILVAQDGLIKFVNPRCAEISGYSKEELLSMSFRNLIHPEDRELVVTHHLQRMQGDDTPHSRTFRVIDKSGNVKWVENLSVPIMWKGNRASLGMVIDVTDRKKAEETLRQSEEKYRKTLETIADGYYEVDLDGTLTLINDSLCEIMGYQREELQGMNYRRLVEEEEAKRVFEAFYEVFSTGLAKPAFTYEVVKKDGTRRHVSVSISVMRNSMGHRCGFRGIFRDITDRKRAEDKLRASLQEKEILLREIHHRVKNNLAVVNSLLRLQSRHAKDSFHREMFREAQDRIGAMAMAHEKLYQSENLACVRIRDYVGSLVDHLSASTGRVGNKIELTKDIEDLSFGLETAGPLGFILTELVSNCMKHAFPQARKGKINISLHRFNGDAFELVVGDDGIGFPVDVTFEDPRSLGLNLVRIFSRQLLGKLDITNNRGTEIKLTFRTLG
jgi:PAS domain S-box-containing protein